MADKKKISKKTLTKAFHHWYYGHLTCFSQEHMQTFGIMIDEFDKSEVHRIRYSNLEGCSQRIL